MRSVAKYEGHIVLCPVRYCISQVLNSISQVLISGRERAQALTSKHSRPLCGFVGWVERKRNPPRSRRWTGADGFRYRSTHPTKHGGSAVRASRRIVASSGRQEPQLVPARRAAPISATLANLADCTAATMAARPTAKQAQTV